MQSQLNRYFEINEITSFEGARGVRNLEKTLKEVCGYSDAFGGVLRNFFEDNPGAVEAVLDWVGQQQPPEWAANLDSLVGEDQAEQ